jgi:AraC-like DNA-binding protein/quercetin dioxygenase-like cupin family protein
MHSTDPEDYQRSPHRVVAMAKDFPAGHVIAPHRHERAQLIHAVTGVMRVATEDGTWVVPAQRALWVPPATSHALSMHGAVAMRTLYIESAAADSLQHRCGVVEVSALLRELILAALDQAPDRPDASGRHGLIEALILRELATVPGVPLHVPMPRDKRLAAICTALIAAPAQADTLDDWALRVGASRRTIARRFRAETGMGFTAWRQQVRLVEALSRLGQGEAVTVIARDLGYDSPSAFSAMFKRCLGRAPSRYFDST